jgi:hypothetical protein
MEPLTMTTTPDPIVLTPTSQTVLSWKAQLAGRPTQYLIDTVAGGPDAVDASHMYAARLLLEVRLEAELKKLLDQFDYTCAVNAGSDDWRDFRAAFAGPAEFAG